MPGLREAMLTLVQSYGFELVSSDVQDSMESMSTLTLTDEQEEDGYVESHIFYNAATDEKMLIDVFIPRRDENGQDGEKS